MPVTCEGARTENDEGRIAWLVLVGGEYMGYNGI